MTRHVLFVAALVVSVTLAAPKPASGDAFDDRPINPREWNSGSIAAIAKRIPQAVIRSRAYVDVPKWNAYLRLALLGNQDPSGRPYRHTYVRCWSSSGWADITQDEVGALLGFYLPGSRSSWVRLPIATCANARMAALGIFSPTTIVALGTVLHETFHRQGIQREDDATCLAAVGVWQAVNRHDTEARADRAWRLVIGRYKRHLTGISRSGLERCAERSKFAWNDSRVWQ
jgi:hypothetical protein